MKSVWIPHIDEFTYLSPSYLKGNLQGLSCLLADSLTTQADFCAEANVKKLSKMAANMNIANSHFAAIFLVEEHTRSQWRE